MAPQRLSSRVRLTGWIAGSYDAYMKPVDKALSAYRASSAEGAPGKKKRSKKPNRPVLSEQEERVHSLLDDRPTPAETGAGRPISEVPPADPDETGAARAAKFLLLLEKDDAARILSHLGEDEIEKLILEIARIRRIEKDEARGILRDFGLVKAKGGTLKGGPDAAKAMLTNAFGEEVATSLVKKVMPFGSENPFDFLNDLEFQQILMIMKREPASVLSVVLPYIAPRISSAVLEALPPDLQTDVVRRIAGMREVSPEALISVAEVLRDRIRKQGRVVTEEVDGRAALARILRHMPLEKEEEILDSLADVNPEVSEEIRDQLITIDVVFQIDDQDLQEVLREFSDTEIAVVLKGKTEDTRKRVFSNISERRGVVVREEMIRLGPMKRSEVGKATREFLSFVRTMEEDGRLVIHRDDEYLVD